MTRSYRDRFYANLPPEAVEIAGDREKEGRLRDGGGGGRGLVPLG